MNSSVYNQSEEWSAGTTSGSAYSGSYTFETTFNGSTTGNGASAATNNGNDYQITLPSGVSIGSGVTVYVAAGQQAANLWLNDREVTMNALITTFTSSDLSGDTTLTKIGVDAGIQVVAVKCDGKLLVDDDVTPTNVPSIATTYRANPNTGFSIVTATASSTSGATMSIAHGLNAKPNFILGKDRENGVGWAVYHSALGATKKLDLNGTDAAASNANYWANTEPTSNVLYTNAASWMYTNADTVFYVWSEVAGYSKFGTFEGNASTNGPFVWCGFRPKWIMLKNIDTASRRWVMLDNVRDPSNGPNNGALWANQDDAESVNNENNIDYLSNGFKLKCTNGNANESGDTFIFAAFAESPFKYSNAR